MASTRARLSISYALVLLGTMVVFGLALLAGRRAGSRDELARQAFSAADVVWLTMQNAVPSGRRLTYVDSTRAAAPTTRATRELGDVLDPLPGYFMVLDGNGKLLYSSSLIRQLSGDDQITLLRAALQLKDETGAVIADVRDGSIQLLAVNRASATAPPNISRVIAALPTDLVELPARLLLGTMVILAPLIFILSVFVAHVVVGRAFRPVDQLINEVEAITDGRSLHRRLAADSSNDELARLGITVNAMLVRLEASFAALRRFTADASHELRTPLTVLRADVERAMHPVTNRNDQMVALEEALQETTRMADLVDSLLTLARADEGRFDIHRTSIELEPLVREVYETAVILGEDAGLTIAMPSMVNVTVMGDRTRLRQLFLNLITNAIKYTPKGGRIEVSVVARPHDEVAIVVRDTGMGIAANDLPHVFDRFWRADRVRSRASERGGFGLGLAISQWIVQAHGGSLTAQSRLGRGSIFTVVLPVAMTAKRAQAVAAEVQHATE